MRFLDFFSKRPREPEAHPEQPLSDPAQKLRIVYAYHEQTKHGLHRYAAGPYELDWENQPDPFRRWEGAALLPLDRAPADLALDDLDPGTTQPAFDAALEEGAIPPAPLDRRAISQLLFDSLALSAWKQVEDTRWALRVNPSSGNLHPTEGYLLLPGVEGLCDGPRVVHYAPREHALEVRAELPPELWAELSRGLPPGAFFAGLTSIHWREAWKYGERAFRYCQHDVGHAIGALSIASAGLGWTVELVDTLATEDLAALLGVFAESGPEAELPECLLLVRPADPAADPRCAHELPAELATEFRALAWSGRANDLSPEHVEWDAIDLTAAATHKPRTEVAPAWQRPSPKTLTVREDLALRAVIRQRRSAQSLDRKTGMSAADFFRVLERTLPRAGRAPFQAFPFEPRIHLALFVHRVEGLVPGLYWLQRDPARSDAIRAACRPEFLWETPAACPEDLPLSLLLPMDLRSTAVQLSCGQDIAGDGAFSLGMLADYERSLEGEGPWFYPRLFWEAGALGQVLYLEAEALGLRATGIGCYFDDPVHSLLGLRDRTLQSLYHFTLGKAVDDPRLSTLPAYPDERGGPASSA